MRESKVVSIWLGNFDSDLDLDEYLHESFTTDFGFEIYFPAAPETDVSESKKTIRNLLDGFSSSSSFLEAAVEGAENTSWKEANTAMVYYGFRYKSELINPKGSGHLKFLGVFSFGAE